MPASSKRSRIEDFADVFERRIPRERLVLPDEQARQVDEILAASRSRTRVLRDWGFDDTIRRGKGIVALFAGPPGTGKTFCAEIIASQLSKGLYEIASSRIVSKWVGETEKNISELFRRARAGGIVLLFDEADTLFSSRVEVKSSVDRYSNLAINQLLTEIERYEGIVILTTNRKSDIDPAFLRRIHYVVDFPLPEMEARRRIWQELVPGRAPLGEDVDFDVLARTLEMSGGHIRNVVLESAWLACSREAPITMDVIREVAEREARGAGALFRWKEAK